MINLLVLVLNDISKGEEVLERWEAGGVKGVTIFESMGLSHLREHAMRDDVPLMPSLQSLLEAGLINHRTLFAVIDDDATLERAIAEAQAVVGDFDEPHTGIMFVVPVARAWGMRRHSRPA